MGIFGWLETAKSGRSKCRKCNQPIEKGTKRFGIKRLLFEYTSTPRVTVFYYHPECIIEDLKILCVEMELAVGYKEEEDEL